jgi:hypothetical protein
MTIISFPSPAQAPNRLKCSECGVEIDAGCNCGALYVPAAKRVADYDKANPGRSTRQAAADLGVSQPTVVKARKSGDNQLSPATVTGRDGKRYSIRKRTPSLPAMSGSGPAKNDDTGGLSAEELAKALKKVGAKLLNAALDLGEPEVKGAVVKHVLRQNKRSRINWEMTNALRAGLSTRTLPAHEVAFSKIVMELDRLHLNLNDVSVVLREPREPGESDACEQEQKASDSRLIPNNRRERLNNPNIPNIPNSSTSPTIHPLSIQKKVLVSCSNPIVIK